MEKGFYGTEFAMAEVAAPVFPPRSYNVRDFGGLGDGREKETTAIGRAIEACHASGGGMVVVPAGQWSTGPIHLKSGVHLRIEKDAVVRFSGRFEDYLPAVFTRWEGIECYNYSPLIYANGCQNIAVTGEGTLVGGGTAWHHWKKLQQGAADRLYEAACKGVAVKDRVFATERDALRPSFLQPVHCRNVLIEGVSVVDGPMWSIHPVYCENLIVRNVKVTSRGPNTDGLNPDSCRNVLIEGCRFETGDDCIAINSGINEDGWRVGKPCENLVIRDCHMIEGHGGVVIGSGMSGGVRNVFVSGCRFTGGERGIRIKSMRGRGGCVENVWFDSIEIDGMKNEAIQINVFYGSSTVLPKTDTPPDFRNMHVSNVKGQGARIAVEIRGLPEHLLSDLHLRNVSLGADRGIVCHDVEKLEMENVRITASRQKASEFGNVKDLRIENSVID